jgi:hypothetical protein
MAIPNKNTSNVWKKTNEWLRANKSIPKSVTSSVSIPQNQLQPLYNNDGAIGSVSIVLPPVALCLGKQITVDNMEAQLFAVGPQNDEKFIGGTNGKSRYNSTAGTSITLGATVDGWIIRNANGTWNTEA